MGTLVEERVAELQGDRVHGASWMARRAVETLVEIADDERASTDELLERLTAAARELAWSRPGVGAIAGAVGRLLATAHKVRGLPPDDFRRVVRDEARGLLERRDRAGRSIAIQLRERLTDALVLTHSASATVREALLYTPPAKLYCTVSAPNEEGRAFSEELREAGINVELVEDEAAVDVLDGASLLLVGADTVFRDGTLCNKIGTSRLARAATERDVPMMVACEEIKLAPFDPDDVPRLGGEFRKLFDLTVPEDVDTIVTEEGSHRPDEVRALVDRTPFLAEGYRLLRGE